MLLFDDFFVDFNRSFSVSDPFVLNVKVAHFPSFVSIGVDFLFNSFFIEEPRNSELIEAGHFSFLLDALIVDVSDIRAGVEEIGFDGAEDLLAFKGVIQAFFFIQIVNFFGNEVMAFQVVNGEFAELFVGGAFIAFGARIVEKEACEFHFKPCGGVRVSVELNDDICDSGGNDACILFSRKVHGLVFEFRELFVELFKGEVVELGNGIVIIGLISSFGKSDFTGGFDKEEIGLFVPIERIDSEVFGASDKYKGAFGVEGTVEPGAARTSRDPDNKGVFEGVALRREVTIVVGLGGSSFEVAGIVGMGEESNREFESVDPVAFVGGMDLGDEGDQ